MRRAERQLVAGTLGAIDRIFDRLQRDVARLLTSGAVQAQEGTMKRKAPSRRRRGR